MNIDNAKYLDKIEKIQKRYPYQQMPEHLKRAFEQDMRIRLSWNTNSLEGNTLSLEETVEIISYDEVRSGHTYSEYTEAKNSYKAYQKMNFSQVQEIDLNLIRQINGIIMDSDGNFRTNQVYIGSLAEVAFLPPEPEKIEERMENYLSSHANAGTNRKITENHSTDCETAYGIRNDSSIPGRKRKNRSFYDESDAFKSGHFTGNHFESFKISTGISNL